METEWKIDAGISTFTAIRNVCLNRRFLIHDVESLLCQVVNPAESQEEIEKKRTGPEFDAAAKIIVKHVPNLEADLHSRYQPLEMQWRARGPGIVRSLEKTTGLDLPSVSILPTHPWVGGDVFVISVGEVAIEAVLTDIDSRIPELVRLAWGVAQSACPDDSRAFQLATIPATLSAAADVELVQFDEQLLYVALQLWRVAEGAEAEDLASRLVARWCEYKAGDSFEAFAEKIKEPT